MSDPEKGGAESGRGNFVKCSSRRKCRFNALNFILDVRSTCSVPCTILATNDNAMNTSSALAGSWKGGLSTLCPL